MWEDFGSSEQHEALNVKETCSKPTGKYKFKAYQKVSKTD